MVAVEYQITCQTVEGKKSKKAIGPSAALAWMWEMQEYGATDIKVSDGTRSYTEAELSEMLDASRS